MTDFANYWSYRSIVILSAWYAAVDGSYYWSNGLMYLLRGNHLKTEKWYGLWWCGWRPFGS